MTPLLGTKTSSVPVGDVPGGDKRAARATPFKVFHETRDTGLPGAPRKPARIPRFSRITRHETRITAFMLFTKHGFYRRLCARGGAARNLRPVHCARRQVTDFQFTIVRRSSRLFAIVQQKNIVPASVRAPSGVLVGPHDWPACLITRRGEMREPGGGKRRAQEYLPNRLLHPSGHETRPLRFNGHQTFLLEQTSPRPWFSRITSHESRITAFMFFTKHETRVTNHGFYRRPVAAFLRVVAQRLRRYGVAMERLWRVWGGCGAAVAVERHGRHIAPAPASLPRQPFSVALRAAPTVANAK